MKKLLKALALALGFGTPGWYTPVYAGEYCQVGDACDTQRVQTNKPDYVGSLAPTPVDMVCLTALASRPSGLVLAKGRVAPREAVTGKVITSWRQQASLWRQTSRGYEREICIPARMVRGTVTLCNEENRSVWTSSDTSYLRRVKRIPSDNAACLLGKQRCASLGL